MHNENYPFNRLIPHNKIVEELIQKLDPVDFRKLTKLSPGEKLKNNHYQIITVQTVLDLALSTNRGICRNHEFIYLYNGAYWSYFDAEELKAFLGESAEKLGVDEYKARYFTFREQLYKQFMALANLPTPTQVKDAVTINLRNGTFEITPRGNQLRAFKAQDFLTYQLPFDYNPSAKAPRFQAYLDQVLPNKELQNVLSEYIGYIFTKNGLIKEEKILFLLGSGENGKSVFYEIIKALLGNENISAYSLQELTNENGYYRAMIGNKLLNYSSDIGGSLESGMFKKLASGETISVRLPYGKPFDLVDYAKCMFNINELPKDVEFTNAYYRRFQIIPFKVTIPKHEQDKELHLKIIKEELSGVFNWALAGLNRLLEQKKFSSCGASDHEIEIYKTESDTVKMFIEDNGYKKDIDKYILLKDLYPEYRNYCYNDGYSQLNKTSFRKRLQAINVQVELKTAGYQVYISKE